MVLGLQLSYPFLCDVSLICCAFAVQSALSSSWEIALSLGINSVFLGGGEFRVFLRHHLRLLLCYRHTFYFYICYKARILVLGIVCLFVML